MGSSVCLHLTTVKRESVRIPSRLVRKKTEWWVHQPVDGIRLAVLTQYRSACLIHTDRRTSWISIKLIALWFKLLTYRGEVGGSNSLMPCQSLARIISDPPPPPRGGGWHSPTCSQFYLWSLNEFKLKCHFHTSLRLWRLRHISSAFWHLSMPTLCFSVDKSRSGQYGQCRWTHADHSYWFDSTAW